MHKIFAGLVLFYQFLICFMYGFFINEPTNANTATSLVSFMLVAIQMILIIAGFGLLFNRCSNKLSFSGLGFNLLIVALTVESYFLLNAFWSKSEIQPNSVNTFETRSTWDIYLSVFEDGYQTSSSLGANMNEALKCALSMIVAFSVLVGRIGPLEIFILSVLGTAAYELTRQVNIGANTLDIGSMKIFEFGGALGLGISILLKAREA